jgi:indole-3-glycerol phosphate synthase
VTILEEINEVKREEVKSLRRNFSHSRFRDSEFFDKPKISLSSSLNRSDRISIIAEIKKASPSRGIIRENFNHQDIAKEYMDNEVEAISILTDVNFFQGNIKYLHDIALFKVVPLLRKDFIIDEYQIFEAKANGADAILLIAESLSEAQIKELTEAAIETDLEVLLELHSIKELEKIDFNLNRIIGVNNRDLNNFSVDLNSTENIGKLIPADNLLVSESGIKSERDLEFIKSTNSKAILVGEHIMLSENIGNSIEELKKWCQIES